MKKYTTKIALILLLFTGAHLPIGCSGDESSSTLSTENIAKTFAFSTTEFQQSINFENGSQKDVEPVQNLVDKVEYFKPLQLAFNKGKLTITDELLTTQHNFKIEGKTVLFDSPDLGYQTLGEFNEQGDVFTLTASFYELQGFNRDSFHTMNVNALQYGPFLFDQMKQRYEHLENLKGNFLHVNLVYNEEKSK